MSEFLTDYKMYLLVIAALIMCAAFFRKLFQVLGIVIIPEDQIGLVTKKFVLFGEHKELPQGRILALRGEAGYQAQILPPGLYFWKWIWQYEITLQPIIQIPDGKIGLIIAKDGAEIPRGSILGRKTECDRFQNAVAFLENGGQKGRQTQTIPPGSYRINTFLFDIILSPMIRISDNMVGIVTTLDGEALPEGAIAGKLIEGHSNFQDADAFLSAGGNRGPQPQVILGGVYFLNPWFVQVEQIVMTEIPIGHVGVVISYFGAEGQDVSGVGFKHGNIVPKGSKGVWDEPLGPGKYPLNHQIMRIELVPTTNLVLNWATARSESHALDKHLSTITVRSKDGFPFNLDVSQIIHIPMSEASKVIARFGNMNNLVSQVLEPTIGNYFRNSAQDSDVITFLTARKERQASAKEHINNVLELYNVNGVDTLIGDIVPPDSLMKTLTDRKLAEEQKVTYDTQKMAQQTRQQLEKETAVANMQSKIVEADQGVLIAERIADATIKKAEGDAQSMKLSASAEAERTKLAAAAEAERISKTGEAEANKILAVGKANAESYQLAVSSIGQEYFTKLKVVETLAKDKVKIIPDVYISGGSGSDASSGPIASMLSLKLIEELSKKTEAPKTEV